MKFKELYDKLIETEENLHHVKIGLVTTKNPDELIKAIELELFKLSKEVFNASKIEYKYWSHCPTLVYKITYKDRLHEALNDDYKKIDSELKFVEKEIEYLSLLKTNFKSSKYHSDLSNPIDKKIRFLEDRKLELLTSDNGVLTDYSNSSAIEKIIYLERLGVLDFLRKHSAFNNSTNNLAKYLSAVTGENASTLQSYLNPIYSTQTNQKNNPLNKKKAVEMIEKQLNTMGVS